MKFSIIFSFTLVLVIYTTLVSAQGFRKDNADKAEKLQKDFEKLTKDSPCKSGENACVDDKFAQCVGGKFVLNACAGGLKCCALPLVNKAGTSITCTTEADRLARLKDARGGNKKRSRSRSLKRQNDDIAEIRKQNADEAETLQESFKNFDVNKDCKDNDVACAGDKFVKCANGKFVSSDCASGLKCCALPLVLKKGVSITCTTEEDRVARIDQARKNL